MTLVVHELRSPLAFLATATSFLSEECSSPDLKARCEVIENTVLRMLRVTEGILEVAGTLERDREDCLYDPVAIVRNLVEDNRKLGYRLAFVPVVLGLDSRAWGAPAVFESLVQSLLNNAIDHGPPGGVVAVRLTSAGAELRLEVENELGPAGRHRGLGLGRVLCARLAAVSGAAVEQSSAAGQFVATVRLPLLPREPVIHTPHHEPSRAPLRQLQAAGASA